MKRRLAFTLVEMLAATVLLGLLMVGVLAVVRDLGAGSRPVGTPMTPHAAAGTADIDRWVALLARTSITPTGSRPPPTN